MEHVTSAVLGFVFLVGLVAGIVFAPAAEAAGCFDDCNVCCLNPDGSICTVRICE